MSNPEALIAYGDIAITSQDGHHWPAFFPAFDYERLLEQGYAASWFAAPPNHRSFDNVKEADHSVPSFQRHPR